MPPFSTISSTRLLQCFLRLCVTNTRRKEDAKTRKNAILKYKLNPLGNVSCPPSCDVNLLFRTFPDQFQKRKCSGLVFYCLVRAWGEIRSLDWSDWTRRKNRRLTKRYDVKRVTTLLVRLRKTFPSFIFFKNGRDDHRLYQHGLGK